MHGKLQRYERMDVASYLACLCVVARRQVCDVTFDATMLYMKS